MHRVFAFPCPLPPWFAGCVPADRRLRTRLCAVELLFLMRMGRRRRGGKVDDGVLPRPGPVHPRLHTGHYIRPSIHGGLLPGRGGPPPRDRRMESARPWRPPPHVGVAHRLSSLRCAGGAGQGGDGQTPDIASGSDPEGCWQARCGRFVDARPTGTGAAQRVPI